MDLETEGEVDETYYNQPGATNNTSPIGLARFAYTVTSQAGVSGAEFGEDTYGGRLVGANDVANFALGNNITCSFSSSFDIFETQYKCTISEDEFNLEYNHPERSKNYPLYIVLELYTWHSLHHLEHIRVLKKNMDWK